MHDRMEPDFPRLLPLYRRERAADRACVLAVVTSTAGSTYRKAGAAMLIAADGEYAGLLSGGCLEGDLREHASEVIADGAPRKVSYDMRGPDDLLWGLGSGCEGAMEILLVRSGPENGWAPFPAYLAALETESALACALVTESAAPGLAPGTIVLPGAASSPPALEAALVAAAQSGPAGPFALDSPALRAWLLPLVLPPRVLLLGGGPDAVPVSKLCELLGWRLTVADHRAAWADARRFPATTRVLHLEAGELAAHVGAAYTDAAIVMSHHLDSDRAWLDALCDTTIGYVGLLGPPPRRERLLGELGARRALLEPRLHAPVGVDLGGRSPEAIALSIAAGIQAWLAGREVTVRRTTPRYGA